MKKVLALVIAGMIGSVAPAAFAADAAVKTVAAVHQEKAELSGKAIQVSGKVVKVNNGIMGRNFVHVRDGSGDQATNNLIVTSKDTAVVGDEVVVTGNVKLDRDFGSGYMYPLLVEDASIAKK
ncbi:hypothetical protein SAMN05421829_101456 [Aromatoleum tolulyticum]|uniref:tRNA_anti-like n=1 Tax=Aromatoleum tolulyticum TaxID=34027 RepID=A0A1N6NU55_9RHOO|nr:hypothetical protein [Aromatoleum tolulyticum]SIP95553.1 hypothetical protein SAMN05421829_101456 [Aromatoleum tolulyticum]